MGKKRFNQNVEPFNYKVLFINIILFAVAVFVISRLYLVYKYDIDLSTQAIYQNINFNTQFYEEYTYTFGTGKSDINFKNVGINSVYSQQNLISTSENSATYALSNNTNDLTSELVITIYDNEVYSLKNKYEGNGNLNFFDLLTKDSYDNVVYDYIKSTNINSEIDFIRGIDVAIETSIFSSVSEIKKNYAESYIINNFLNDDSVTSLISGDCSGYIIRRELNDITVVLIKDNVNYKFDIKGDYEFDSLDSIKSWISTVVFN